MWLSLSMLNVFLQDVCLSSQLNDPRSRSLASPETASSDGKFFSSRAETGERPGARQDVAVRLHCKRDNPLRTPTPARFFLPIRAHSPSMCQTARRQVVEQYRALTTLRALSIDSKDLSRTTNERRRS
ncbi:hypothetical protein NVV93_03340 [Pseudomonas sp. LS44]|uniref:hypothetical protein n=1 Tax=Pseudomonas sp. LS44 TaxID=1357074 RepID=UPI00215A7EF5|nr:hypothetical protein [Pseudomonas sp. LS44]UVE18453.1 hypothetical protein NVV93_03340 [Pseudomonas sp. LS44]